MKRLLAALVLLAIVGGVAVWVGSTTISRAADDQLHNCPQAGKWAIATWDGADGTSTEQAVATCGDSSVDTVYWLDPDSQGWKRYISGRPEVSNLNTLDDHQGVLALGSVTEVTPTPTPTPTATPTATAGTTGDVTLVSSNGFTRTMFILIDGEDREVTVVGEVRNDSSVDRSAGEITIRFYDAADQIVGVRKAHTFDDIIRPGRTTAFNESVPSMLYFSDETNDFPEGWTRYDITLDPRDPYEFDDTPVDIAVENVEVTDGGRHVTGTAVNASSKTVDKYGVDAYVIYYGADGAIINAEMDLGLNGEPLGPGQSVPFDISFSSGEPVDYSSYVVQAVPCQEGETVCGLN